MKVFFYFLSQFLFFLRICCKNEYQTDDAYGYYSFYPKGEKENGGAAQSDQGWASYKVGDDVQNHTAYGIGIYFVLNDGLPARVMDHTVYM